MIFLILIPIVIIALTYIIKNKLVIRVDTFFRKGFAKHDDKYGVYCFCREAGRPAKHTVLLIH